MRRLPGKSSSCWIHVQASADYELLGTTLRDIEVIAIDSFRSYLGDMKCTRAEVEVMERRRYSTLPRLKRDLVAHLNSGNA
jgi:hypothetical protein